MSESPTIHSNHATAAIVILRHGNWNVCIVSLDIFPEVQRGVSVWSGKDSIGMNPHGTIGGNVPKSTGQEGFDLFDLVMGMLEFSNTIVSWFCA